MLLRSVKVERWRCYVEPFTLGGLGPGITVVHGPNGSGKSTLVQALRFAFFESHRVGGETVKRQLWPWGHEEAKLGPTVVVEFDEPAAGRRWRLRKRFLRRAVASLKQFDGARYVEVESSTAADERARQFLLGTRAGRGLTRAEHLGLARILWTTEQGELALALGERPEEQPLLERLRQAVGTPAVRRDLSTVEAQVAVEAERALRNDGRPRAGTEAATHQAKLAEVEAELVPLKQRINTYERLAWELAQGQRQLHELLSHVTPPASAPPPRNELTSDATISVEAQHLEQQRDAAVAKVESALEDVVAAARLDDATRLDHARTAFATALDALRLAERAHATALAQQQQPTATAPPESADAAPHDAGVVAAARRRVDELRGRIRQLLDELTLPEGDGLYERVHRLEEAAAATREALALHESRLAALAMLRDTLEACRHSHMQAVAGPLESALNATLARLGFRHAHDLPVRLNAGFSLAGLAAEAAAQRPVAIEELSEGEQEQLYLALRVELARRISSADEPQVAILDDTLTATDATRLPALLELLSEAAEQQHLQVLIFTCHPERYAALNATHRPLNETQTTG